MATSHLTNLTEQKKTAGLKTMSGDSISWLKGKIEELKRPDRIATSISREQLRQTNMVKIGMLYFFYYDPKTKADLPYWDRFPLVLVL